MADTQRSSASPSEQSSAENTPERSTPPPTSVPSVDDTEPERRRFSSHSLNRLRVNIARIICWSFAPLLIVVVLMSGVLVAIIGTGLGWGQQGKPPSDPQMQTQQRQAINKVNPKFLDRSPSNAADPVAVVAFAASMQVAFGMIIGFVCVYIGLMMTWFGIDAAFEMEGDVRQAGGVALKSSSPGLLFALGGMILIAVSLYKPIVYEVQGGFVGKSALGRTNDLGDRKRNAPPPIEHNGADSEEESSDVVPRRPPPTPLHSSSSPVGVIPTPRFTE